MRLLRIIIPIIFNAAPTNCGGEITTPGTVFASINYPNNYLNNEDCSRVIRFTEGQTISMKFLEFSLEGHNSCRCVELKRKDDFSNIK